MEIGIVGLPNVGKSSLFNALTSSVAKAMEDKKAVVINASSPTEASAKVGNFPFTTIEPNVGVVSVPDERLDFLATTFASAKTVPATIKFVDIAGLVKGAAQGEGLGNKFLSHIRSVDAIAEVVRVFENDDIIHVTGAVNPGADITTINTELLLADLEVATKALEQLAKNKSSEPYAFKGIKGLEQAIKLFNDEVPLRTKPELAKELASFQFLTAKPLMYIANISDNDSGIETIQAHADKEAAQLVAINVKAELEVVELPAAEQAEYRAELGLKSGLGEVIKAGYELLGLVTFFTAGPTEAHAWTISKNTKAPQAAGKIHTDFEKGFIRAQVYAFEDIKKLGSEKAIRDAGKLRSEGKEYVVQDGDVVEFLFNV